MFEKLISERIKKMRAYIPEDAAGMTALDKNENPFEAEDAVKSLVLERLKAVPLNRYPDNDCRELKKAVAAYAGVPEKSIVAGNGSDELIHMVMEVFVEPGDKIVTHNPTFSMYRFYATLCGGEVKGYETGKDLQIDPEGFKSLVAEENPKLLVLCNPNNPTGGLMALRQIEELLACFDGMLLVDEAYFEFSGVTALALALRNDRVVVLRTLSKALGLAGLRIGYAVSVPEIAAYMERARPPFNISALSQAAAVAVLENPGRMLKNVERVKEERSKMAERLSKIRGVTCYPSAANFILIRVEDREAALNKLAEKRIRVKSFNGAALDRYLRITVGKPEENDRLCSLLEEVYDERYE